MNYSKMKKAELVTALKKNELQVASELALMTMQSFVKLLRQADKVKFDDETVFCTFGAKTAIMITQTERHTKHMRAAYEELEMLCAETSK